MATTKKDLIPFCRYYKGEKERPYKEGDKAFFWDWESKWVEFTLTAYKNSEVGILGTMIDEYLSCGLRTFNEDDGVPTTLKALLFNRYLHQTNYPMKEGAELFKKFYNDTYKKGSHN